jgi:hypothetical protein
VRFGTWTVRSLNRADSLTAAARELTRSFMWGMVWVELASDRDRWKALVNTVMNLPVPQNVGNFLTK